jgi:MATE family multidrug resistance protein
MAGEPVQPDEAALVETAHPAWAMLKLAAPTVATMASYTCMQFADGWMVSRIEPPDPVYIAAQGNGGVWAFVPMSIFAGVVGVVNTYVAQNLGAGRPERGPAYAWNALWLGLLVWLAALLPMAVALPWVFAHLGHSPELQRLETSYAQILLAGGIITMVSRGLSQFFYGLHRPGITLVGAVAGNLTNLGLNWVFIYGNLGAPALGVAGSAIATVLGTMVEAAIPLAVFLSRDFQARYGTRSAWRPSLAHLRDIVRLGWPSSVMFGNEMVCWAIFMTGLAGHFGKAHNAAGWITLRYMHLSFMPAVGISFACTAMVGKCLGAGRPDLARERARLGVMMAMAYMGVCALVFIVFRHALVGVFVHESVGAEAENAEVIAIASRIMIVAAVFQVFDGLGISLIGVLRGAGDTVWPGVVTIVLSWVFILGLGAGLAFGVPSLGSLGPWIGAAAYIIVLGLCLSWRFRGDAWLQRKVLHDPATP